DQGERPLGGCISDRSSVSPATMGQVRTTHAMSFVPSQHGEQVLEPPSVGPKLSRLRSEPLPKACAARGTAVLARTRGAVCARDFARGGDLFIRMPASPIPVR